jgi:ABC-type Fe3+/spermidine/putrescine transport system ATPase subunit
MLKISNLSMDVGGFSLREINLQIEKGEYFVLAGPSGSGKSLLLETVAGIFKPGGNGRIVLDNEDITHTAIQRRNVGLVFQDNTLFHHLSVKKNVEYALKLKYDHKEVHAELDKLCQQFGIGHLLNRDTRTLSGGESQRVQLARAFAPDPKIMLLDEPLSAVDTDQRDQLKSLLRAINRSGLTVIHVTHDFEEAFSLSTTIGIMHNGRIVETGRPNEIIEKPGSKFAARFYGYKNYFEAFLESPGSIRVNNTHFRVNENEVPGQHFSIIIDAAKVEIFYSEDGLKERQNCLEGVVSDFFTTVKGTEIRVKSAIDLHVQVPKDLDKKAAFFIGQTLFLYVPPEAIKMIKKINN